MDGPQLWTELVHLGGSFLSVCMRQNWEPGLGRMPLAVATAGICFCGVWSNGALTYNCMVFGMIVGDAAIHIYVPLEIDTFAPRCFVVLQAYDLRRNCHSYLLGIYMCE